MDSLDTLVRALPWVVGGLIFAVALVALRRPLRVLLRLAARTLVSLLALFAFSSVGSFFGLGLGVNLANALVIGILGVPGFGLLLLLQWTLG